VSHQWCSYHPPGKVLPEGGTLPHPIPPLSMKLISIKSRWFDKIILKGKAEGIKELLEKNRGADLRDAYLRDAYLRGADLRGADLRDADLRDADLTGADLRDADLRDADLTGADLRDADLTGADLRDADLIGADLRDADLWWHVHHNKLWEPLTEPIRNRINYIKNNKPKEEIELRLRLLKPVLGEFPKDDEGWEKLHQIECKNCPWNGKTIFP